jgi:hypothetical protein
MMGGSTARFFLLRGVLFEHMGCIALAEKSYRNAMTEDLDVVMTRYPVLWLEHMFDSSGGADRRIAGIEKKIESGMNTDSRHLPLLNAFLGWRYSMNGNTAKSLRYSEIARSLDPSCPLPYYTIGFIHLSRGDAERALNSYEDGLCCDNDLHYIGMALDNIHEALESGDSGTDTSLLRCFLCLLQLGAGDEIEALRTFGECETGTRQKAVVQSLRKRIQPLMEKYDAKVLEKIFTLWNTYTGGADHAKKVWNAGERALYERYDWSRESLKKRDLSGISLIPALRTLAKRRKDFILRVAWRDGSRHFRTVFTSEYLLIRTQSGFELANPLYEMTRTWRKMQYEPFVFYLPQGKGHTGEQDLEASAILSVNFLSRLSEKTGVPVPEQIHYYLLPADIDPLHLFPLDWNLPSFLWSEKVILSTHLPDFSQLARILLNFRRSQSHDGVPELINTGLSSYFGGVSGVRPHFLPTLGYFLVASGRSLPIRENPEFTGLDPLEAKAMTASFISWLAEDYTVSDLMSIFLHSEDIHSMEESLESATGSALKELISAWKERAHQEKPEIAGAVGRVRGDTVFSAVDPLFDDTGAGYYGYPSFVPCQTRIFDLTGVKITTTEQDNFFEVSLHHLLPHKGSAREAFSHTFVRILLWNPLMEGVLPAGNALTDMNLPADTQPFFHYMIDVSGQGIMMKNGTGRIESLTPHSLIMPLLTDSNRGLIAFSVPVNLIGEIRAGWKCAVITACALPAAGFSEGTGVLVDHGSFASGHIIEPHFPNLFDILLPYESDQTERLRDIMNKRTHLRSILQDITDDK